MVVEKLSTPALVDRTFDLVSLARALELAISGSTTLAKEEMQALDHLAETLVSQIGALHDELNAQHHAELEADHV
ncbi:hypothetical protein AMST5_03613 [freshwater sediment metagenome]|uniref:Uncharacterized protein n=1 Tax=freshwater sediment metagenome TaxID=556182 RepID=A0AA48M463_9ZZZZ